ncbi:MAG: hypothetical protein U9N50_04520 [Pseudomonadota bacterium]|nr:hypothetical protein [Pseudomonadota bacterium]
MISRSLCHYHCFQLKNVPVQERRQVLNLKIIQWAPFEQPRFNIAWQGDSAQVWCWDTLQVEFPAETSWLSKAVPLVETRFYQRPEGDQLRLLQCVEGVEGQHWKKGLLAMSRWWAESPSQQDWVNFQRSASLKPEAEVPAAINLPMLNRPWGKSTSLEGMVVQSGNLLPKLLLLVVFFMLSWKGMEVINFATSINDIQQQGNILANDIEPLLQARKTTLEDYDQAVFIHGLWPEHSQLQLLDDVVATLPRPKDMEIEEWIYEPTHLTFVVKGKNLDPSILVRAYEGLEWTRNVAAEPDNKTGRMRVSMQFNSQGSR